MVDILKFLKHEPFDSFESSIGLLYCFSSSMKDQSLLDEKLTVTLEDTAPEEFAREFAGLVCFPPNSLKDGKTKPDEPVLKEADVQQLTTEDLETFAKLYVENNSYLFKKREQKRKPDTEENTDITPPLGEVEHPRVDDESYVNYLHRLTIIEREQQREQLQKITQLFSSFSGGVAESLRKTLSRGDVLKRELEQLRPEPPGTSFTIERKLPDVDWAEIHRNTEAARRAPFDELAKRLDQLIDSSIESSKFMIESNEIQAQVAEEIKKSGDSASRFSSRNLWLSGLIIVLTFYGLVITAYSMKQSSKQSELAQDFSRDALQKLNKNLNNLSDTIARGNVQSKAVLDAQLDALTALTEEREMEAERLKIFEDHLKVLREENGELKAELKQLREQANNVQKSSN